MASTVKKTTVKKTHTKNKEKKLGKKQVKENSPEVKSVDNESSSNKELENAENSENEINQQDLPPSTAGGSTSHKEQPQSRKRRAADSAGTSSGKTKTKKQKVVYEVPEISSVAGKIFVIGDNSVGQLGFNCDDVMEKKRPALLEMPYSIVDIAAGGMHSVCLTQTGEVITFGLNDEGALGRKTEDGTEYIPQKVEIPKSKRIVQISAGDSHSAALSESGEVFIWGNFRNNNGVMGLITPDLKQELPVQILRDVKIVKISSGSDHLSCLSNEGIVYTCGNGEAGQLGRVSERLSETGGRKGMNLLLSPTDVPIKRTKDIDHIIDVWTGSLATFLKSNNGIILGFGLNNYGQLGFDPDRKRVLWKPEQIKSFKEKSWTEINSGQHHTLALDNEGSVYSLGRSNYGRLGLGENVDESISRPTKIPTLEDKQCKYISCGDSASFAMENNGGVYSWGFGTNYQLGHGNDDDQHVPKLIEGNFFNSWKALKISGGAQHTLILAHPKSTNEESQ